jgi:hypothetical protein
LWVTRSAKSFGGVFCCALAAPIDANSGALMPMRGARSATWRRDFSGNGRLLVR